MAVINQLNCTTFTGGNTGFGRCYYEPKPRKYAILVPKGTIITAADFATIQTYLQGKLINDNAALRFHALGQFEDWEDNSEDRAQQTFGSGRKITTKEPTEQLNYVMYDGGLCNQKNALDFDGAHKGYEVLYVDTENFLQFEMTTTTAGAAAAKGFDMGEFYTYPFKQPTPSNVAMYRISISHENVKEMQKNMGVVPLGFNFDTMRNTYAIQNATLTDVTPGGAAAGVFTVQIMGGCGSDNLATIYGSALASATLFNVTAAGAAITTTYALNAAGDAVVFTMDTLDADYPNAGDPIDISMKAPSLFTAAGISYYEGANVLTVEAT